MTKHSIGGPLVVNGKQIPVSKAMRAGDFIFLSGQLAFEPDGTIMSGGMKDQTTRVLEHVQSILKEADCTMDDIIKCTCWISDGDEFAHFNEVYTEFFGENPPARSCVISQLLLGAKVEIEVVAYKPL